MSLSCPETSAILASYEPEALEPVTQRELREHLNNCAACRQESLHADVGLLFHDAANEELSSEDVARILSGVRAGISWKRAERRLAETTMRRPRRRGLVAAAAAIVAFTLAVPGARPRQSPAHPATNARVSVAMPSEAPLVPAAQSAAPASEVPNSKFPVDATIYDWNPGSGQPRVVWIVDHSLDI